MNRRSFIVNILLVGCFIATTMLIPSLGLAQMDKVKTSMAALKAKTAKLGAPKIEGKDPVAGKDAPALYFGTTNTKSLRG
jgi:hypothetical protein